MSLRSLSSVVVALAAASSFSSVARAAEMRTVPYLDLNRYVGLWYEIARFPNSFQRDCGATTAHYAKRYDGKIDVTNRCVRRSNGRLNVAKGRATVRDGRTQAKLDVTFLPSFLRWLSALGIGNGAYWVLEVGPNYEYAVVSEPSRKFMWILARGPVMSRALYEQLTARARTQGLDTGKLELTTPTSVR